MLYVSWKKYVCLNFQQLKQNGVLLFNFFRGKGAPPEQVNQFDCQFESCFHRFQTPQQVGNSTSRHVQDFGWEKRSPLSLLELQFIEAFLEGVWGSFKRHLFGPFFWGMEKNICGKMMIDVIWVLNYTKFTGSSSGIPCEVEYFWPQQLRKKVWFSHLVTRDIPAKKWLELSYWLGQLVFGAD